MKHDGLPAGRVAYWLEGTKKDRYSRNKEWILVLDTSTIEWSVTTAPFPAGQSYCIAEMADHGGRCLVSSKEQCVKLWVHGNNGEWVLKEISFLDKFKHLKKIRRDEWMKRVCILAAKDGYVFLEFWSIRKFHSYVLVLNLNTMKLEMFRNNSDEPYGPCVPILHAFPFFMRLTPRLLAPDDDRKFHLQGA
uniref:F-box associated domain-containing protein n=1 Tax=Arundo donax TaxID=35708 RepID=A0A0A9GLA3_ARUDO